jgi:hypothetical protein
MTQNKLYFLPVFEHEGGVWANRPNGEAARICVLIEDIHFDADRLLEQMEDNAGTAPPSRLIMQSVAGTILAGQRSIWTTYSAGRLNTVILTSLVISSPRIRARRRTRGRRRHRLRDARDVQHSWRADRAGCTRCTDPKAWTLIELADTGQLRALSSTCPEAPSRGSSGERAPWPRSCPSRIATISGIDPPTG